MNPLISVIVPVYKTELFLNKCISSILNQTYSNVEVIVVDDGSPDQCGQFCDQWAEKDSRIQVIHQENGGLSAARNTGMQHSCGAYLAFVDSDDWVAPDMFEILVNQLEANLDCDVAACGFQKVYSDGEVITRGDTYDFQRLPGEVALQQLICGKLSQVVWNKLYRRELAANVYFEVCKYHEDEFWSYQVIGRARNMLVTNQIGYFYRQRSGSIMDEKYSTRRLDAIEAKCRRQRYLETSHPQLAFTGKIDLLYSCLYHGQQALTSMEKKDRNQVHVLLKQILKEYPLSKKDLAELSWKYRLWLIGAKYGFTTVCWIRNTARIGL